jgi:hypothetical protein
VPHVVLPTLLWASGESSGPARWSKWLSTGRVLTCAEVGQPHVVVVNPARYPC